MNVDLEPKLAPPGAGLPKVELFIAQRLFAWRRRTGNRELFNSRFQQERAKIERMVRDCDAKSAAQRILIQRPRGLEDSSRYWSVWMTLEHLRIVHSSIIRIIHALVEGITLKGTSSTARVKPGAQVTADVVGAYAKSCDDLLATVVAERDLKTPVRYAHPWFG